MRPSNGGLCVYIDQGMYAETSERAAHTPPTVFDHRKFAGWLRGVASARRGRPQRRLERPKVPAQYLVLTLGVTRLDLAA